MLSKQIQQGYRAAFHSEPKLMVRSSGRINLIGEHTDYNGGFVLPAAIDKGVYMAIGPRTDRQCHFVAHDLGETFQTDLDHLVSTPTRGWANYLMGVLDEIQRTLPNATQLSGFNLVFGADLPSGAGLSSSAAIENGIGFLVNTLFDLGLSALELVCISQRAENHFVGMKCGIMDMFASMMGKTNQFIKIDCRDLSYAYFPFHAPDLALVLCDTRVKHALVDSEYNTRRAECEEGVRALQAFDPNVQLLRDVSPAFLKQHQTALSPIAYQRCNYVVAEIARVEQACAALQRNDFDTLGRLMFETHQGLSQDYEVSCTELDYLVELAQQHTGVLGARMMGGGFGGCTINLVREAASSDFVQQANAAYQQRFGQTLPCYVVRPGNGTELIDV